MTGRILTSKRRGTARLGIVAFLVWAGFGLGEILRAEDGEAGQGLAQFLSKRGELHGQMQVEVERLERILELTPAQVRKLETAAKGAVDQVLEERVSFEPADPFVGPRGELPQGGEDGEWIIDPSLPIEAYGALENPVWVEAVSEVLTLVQKTALSQVEAEEAAARRQAAIEVGGFMMQRTLRLTTDQRTSILALMRDAAPEEFFFPGSEAASFCTMLDRRDLEKILSPAQLKHWDDLTSFYLGMGDQLH